MRGLIKLALLASCLALFTGTAYAAEYTIKASMGNGPYKDPHYNHTAFKAWINEIEKESNGRIKVKVFWNQALGKHEKVLDLVRKGLVEFLMCGEGHAAPYYPDVQVMGIPYLFSNRQVAYEVLDGPIFQEFNEKMAKKTGIRPLAWMENAGYRHFSSSNRLMKNAADMKGLKMRTMPNPIHMTIVRSLGMSPTPIAWADLYTALQTGVVDGQENALGTFRVAKLGEVQKYIILDGHVYSVMPYFMSEKFYQKLPDDLKQVIQKATKKALRINREISQKNFESDRAYLTSKGLTIVDPTPEAKQEFKKLTQGPALEALRKNVDPKLIDAVLKAAKDAEAKQKK